MARLEERHWLPLAKMLGCGESDKVIHAGCGQRPSMHIEHEADRYWAYCHRCRANASVSKTLQRIKVKAPEKTGWFPDVIVDFMDYFVKRPTEFSDVIKRFNLAGHVSHLKYSPDTGRVYFPDDTENLLGLDITGKAIARWYSPKKTGFMAKKQDGPARICSDVDDYMLHLRSGGTAMLCTNTAGQAALVAYIVNQGIKSCSIPDGVRFAKLRKELRGLVEFK